MQNSLPLGVGSNILLSLCWIRNPCAFFKFAGKIIEAEDSSTGHRINLFSAIKILALIVIF